MVLQTIGIWSIWEAALSVRAVEPKEGGWEPCKEDKIRRAIAQNTICLFGLGDQADCTGRDAGEIGDKNSCIR